MSLLCTCTAMLSECLARGRGNVSAMAAAPAARRLGATDSKTRAQLLDAAERLLQGEGYAAVTSRRGAAAAELKPQLVHYYFRTMDDLFLEVFRRRAEENLARADAIVATDGSLRSLWELNADSRGAAFMTEFVALANHRKAIRAEIAAYAERYRATQLAALTAAFESTSIPAEQMPPIVALLLMTGLSQVVGIERSLGMTDGHADTIAFIESAIDRLS